MNYLDLANPGVFDQPMYIPGKPLYAVAKEYGLKIDAIDKLASNENPFGPSPKALRSMANALDSVHLYPDGSCTELKEVIANHLSLSSENIIVGNGSNEVIELLGHVFLRPGLDVVVGSYSFIVYRLVARLFGANVIDVPMDDFKHDLKAMRKAITSNTRLVFIASPNNPTGMANHRSEIIEFIESMPEHVILCFDEAYAEYLEELPDLVPFILEGRNIICLRTFSKIYGLGGLRIGYGYGNPKLIALLNRVRQPFNVNSLSQVAAIGALSDFDFLNQCKKANNLGRKRLVEGLSDLGLKVYGGSANFVFVQVGQGQALFKKLQAKGIIIRPLDSYKLPEYIRITIGTESQNERILTALEQEF
ncbi:MAG: histidinol-phosphate transaminase [Opitutae bacterium]|nr:histidinol-phosphate transaminase [Opitutae bacterium]